MLQLCVKHHVARCAREGLGDDDRAWFLGFYDNPDD
jgi:hypothetical protein